MVIRGIGYSTVRRIVRGSIGLQIGKLNIAFVSFHEFYQLVKFVSIVLRNFLYTGQSTICSIAKKEVVIRSKMSEKNYKLYKLSEKLIH